MTLVGTQGLNTRISLLLQDILKAERLGFEPRELKEFNGFRDRPVQPLRHLSVV